MLVFCFSFFEETGDGVLNLFRVVTGAGETLSRAGGRGAVGGRVVKELRLHNGCLGSRSAPGVPERVGDPEAMREAKREGEVSVL